MGTPNHLQGLGFPNGGKGYEARSKGENFG